jgi:hypothetical protein
MIITDSDNDGISDAWEIAYNRQPHHHGCHHRLRQRRPSATSPNTSPSPIPSSPTSFLKVTQVNPLTPGGTTTALTWTSSRTRLYRIETSTDLGHCRPLGGFPAGSGNSSPPTTPPPPPATRRTLLQTNASSASARSSRCSRDARTQSPLVPAVQTRPRILRRALTGFHHTHSSSRFPRRIRLKANSRNPGHVAEFPPVLAMSPPASSSPT